MSRAVWLWAVAAAVVVLSMATFGGHEDPVPPAGVSIVNAASGLHLDSSGGKVYAINGNESANQRWIRQGSSLRNARTGWCLDGATVKACDGSGSQQWTVSKDGRLQHRTTGLCLDCDETGAVRLRSCPSAPAWLIGVS